jgi:hypothetical protein
MKSETVIEAFLGEIGKTVGRFRGPPRVEGHPEVALRCLEGHGGDLTFRNHVRGPVQHLCGAGILVPTSRDDDDCDYGHEESQRGSEKHCLLFVIGSDHGRPRLIESRDLEVWLNPPGL